MGKIRSAWEIVLEKTDNMEIDQEKIRHNSEIDKIRRIAGSFITGDDSSDEKVKKELSAFPSSLLREALAPTILNSIVLPQEKEGMEEKTARISALIDIAFQSPELLSLYGEITRQLGQYPEHKEDLLDKLKEQIEPMLRNKEESMRQKYGQSVHLTIENDKESMEMIRSYIDRLNKQYQDVLENAKKEMTLQMEKYTH